MSSASDDITNQPTDERRTTDITDDVPAAKDDFRPERFTVPPLHENKLWCVAVVSGLLFCVVVAAVGLLPPAVQRMREAAARSQSMNNCKQMCLAVNNIASNTSTGDIPPCYGPFPQGKENRSFFVSLLPYIEQSQLFNNGANLSGQPVKSYIAPADPYNPGTTGLISYGSNATVLTVDGNPTLPGSFNGKRSSTIIVFERTAKSRATWTNDMSYLIDGLGTSRPEFTDASSWYFYSSRATALSSAGCIVGLADGSARDVTAGNANAGWAWAMDPNIPGAQAPSGW
jgi:hypothetical protein